MLPDPRDAPVYIGSEIYRGSTYGSNHPLAIPRVSTCTDLVRALRWLPDARYVAAPMASVAQIARFHTQEYIAALQRAEATQHADAAMRRCARATPSVWPATRSMPTCSAAPRPRRAA